MSAELLDRLKPAARARTHVLAVAGLWTLVGLGLGTAGVVWSAASGLPWSIAWIVLGLGLGAAKARWILAPVARHNVERIVARGDGRCLGGFVSPRIWLLVGGMMAAGYLLRHSLLPLEVLGVIYVTVGTALVLASVPLWRRWVGSGNVAGGS